MRSKQTYRWIAALFFLIPVVLITYKISALGYSYVNILPRTGYTVQMVVNVESFGEPVSVTTWLPEGSTRQAIRDEVQETGAFSSATELTASGRKVTWTTDQLEGKQRIVYRFAVRTEAVDYEINPALVPATDYPPSVMSFLTPTANIQSNHPRILEKVNALTANRETLLLVLKALYADVLQLEPRPFKGLTDALTALKLGEASCNGKSRLFVAYCRNKGIPARLVGGLILENGGKRTSHQWAEVYINGFWVPFDALNDHFASIPANYLRLYTGDEFLFSHTPNIGFDYLFTVQKQLVSNPQLADELRGNALNSYQMWEAFEDAGIPLSLIKIILLMPLGAMIVAIARNVIGLKTFGIFLPALIAVAITSTGLLWGIVAFVLVIMLVSITHFPLERLGMLYTPKLVIMLITVVVAFVVLSVIGMRFDYTELAYITLFPVVVITITAERFARTIMEEDFRKALIITFQTLIVVLMAYFAMNSRTMEALFLAFPELFLVIAGAMLLLGRWMGLRISEYKRFRWLAQ